MLFCSRSPRLFAPALLAALGLAAFGGVRPLFAQTAVLTQNNDNARTGANTTETILTPQNVKVATFGKLFTITGLNANVNGQILYMPGVTVAGAKHNVVYAYTSNNSDNSPSGVYAYDADTGTQLWKTILPPSATYTTATPVIDPATMTLYVLSKSGTDDTGLTYLHAYECTTGAEKAVIQVQASAPGTGDGSANGTVYFDGDHGHGRFHANDRVGLLFANGMVYTAFAHNSDSFPYHGWVLAYKFDGGAKLTQSAVFCTTPNGSDGGIWQAGKGLTADSAGNIYFSVGNGTFNASGGGKDYGMCYMKLGPMLNVLDWFAPFDEQGLSNQDLDLGNSGVVGIPGTTALFGGGTKFGSAFLMDSANLGKFTPNGPDKALARVDGVSGNDQVGQNPIAWDSGSFKYAYLWPGGQPLEQFQFDPAAGTLSPKGIFAKAAGGATNGGALAVSSNGTGNAILWAVGDEGTVRAYDALNVANAELWDSAQNKSRDGIGHTGHFQFPTVVNGKVYVPTGGATIAVYGLLPGTTPPPPAGIFVNDTSGDLAYAGGGWWYYGARGVGDFSDDVHATTVNGASVSYTFIGTAASYIAETNPDEGNVQVYLDGTLQATVSAVSSTRKVQQSLWSKSGLTSGTHTIKLVKQDGQFLVLDALQIAPAFTTTVNDTSAGLTYTGTGWQYYGGARGLGDIGDDVHATRNNGDGVSYTFTGTSVSYVTETNSDEGTVDVYIDGTLKQSVNCSTATRSARQSVYSVSGLPAGAHTIKLVKTGGTFMLLDAIGY